MRQYLLRVLHHWAGVSQLLRTRGVCKECCWEGGAGRGV